MSNSSTTYDIKFDFKGAVAILNVHQHGLLSGDGGPERIRLYEALLEPARKHQELGKPDSAFDLELKVTSGTVKAWLAGAANSIMRHPNVQAAPGLPPVPMNDTHVEQLFNAAKALGFSKELMKKVPSFNAGDNLLQRDAEEEVIERDTTAGAPESDPTSGSSILAGSSDSSDPSTES